MLSSIKVTHRNLSTYLLKCFMTRFDRPISRGRHSAFVGVMINLITSIVSSTIFALFRSFGFLVRLLTIWLMSFPYSTNCKTQGLAYGNLQFRSAQVQSAGTWYQWGFRSMVAGKKILWSRNKGLFSILQIQNFRNIFIKQVIYGDGFSLTWWL